MKWILWVIAVTANGNHIAIDKTEFSTQVSCEAAASQVQGVNNTAIGSTARIEAACLRGAP
ncbi:MAG: hypothetical protein EXR86_00370 [Gammaproteobacteria bacterium]|nr:hypothetical protein [Gammaproteobacteria bacterium]